MPTKGTPLDRIQAKLEVGAASDGYEREADSIAAQVMRGGEAPAAIPPTITPLTAQRKTQPKKPKEDDKKGKKAAGKVQRAASAAGAQGGTAPGHVSASIAAMQSGAAPGLDGGARSFMEGRFGRDFGGVRVHDSPRAAAAADALGAKAFTVGNDIFFNRGQYRPHSSGGRQLLAHELTHTVQQTGGKGHAARSHIQRKTDKPQSKKKKKSKKGMDATGSDAPSEPALFAIPSIKDASIDNRPQANDAMGVITVPQLLLPPIKEGAKGVEKDSPTKPVASENHAVPTIDNKLEFGKPMPKRDPDSIPARKWTEYIYGKTKDSSTLTDIIEKKTAKDVEPVQDESGNQIYYLKLARGGKDGQIFVGTAKELAESDDLLRPQWTAKGDPLFGNKRFDADHFLEMQIGGGDVGENMWLLEASYNRSVGKRIADNMRRDIEAIIKAARPIIGEDGRQPEDYDHAKAEWNITFAKVQKGAFGPENPAYWTEAQVTKGEHLAGLKAMNAKDMQDAGIRLKKGQRPSSVKVYPSQNGGRAITLEIDSKNNVKRPSGRKMFEGVNLDKGTYNPGAGFNDPKSVLLELDVEVFQIEGRGKNKNLFDPRKGTIEVYRTPRTGMAGYLERDGLRALAKTEFAPLCPLTFSDLSIAPEGVLTGTGSVAAEVALFPKLAVPLTLYGDRIGLSFSVPTDNLSLGPVEVTEVTVGMGIGEKGFYLDGYAGFKIKGLGAGSVSASPLDDDPKLAGAFDLETDFFDPAHVEVVYNLGTDTFSGHGELGIESGRIPFIDAANVIVDVSREEIGVNGSVTLGGALKGITINVTYSKAEGIRIGADNIPLPISYLPFVQNATLSVAASKPPNAKEWSFAGHGSATFAIPGVTGGLEVDYLDGAVTIHGQGQVEKGPASGTLDFTATNRQIDEQGKPIEGPPTDKLTGWGKGSVSVEFGKILKGTGGVELTPDNRVILSGTIAMPPVYEVFARRDYTKDLFTLKPPEFPIWGVSVAGVGVGVFAFVDARVFFEAYVGPAQIRDAAVTATLDLDRPEDAEVQGHGEFYVPAYAGLGLDVGGGLRARAAVAFAEGRVGLTGKLGVDIGAGAALDFDWNRANGLALAANLHAEATPKFELSANASVTIGVDLLVTDVSHTFGPWTKELGSFGPDMTLGVKMPVKWSEATGLDMNLDNIEVTRPKLDAGELMSDVFDQLVG